jgi:ADP-heptose:LPS heptosyltransferase
MTHVLAVRLDNAGDVLLAGPAIRAVAARGSRVTLLCGPRGEPAARLLPGVDDVVVRAAEWIDPEPSAVRRAAIDAYVDAIAALDADEAIIFTSFHQSPLPAALLLRLAGVRRLSAISDDYPGSLLDVRHRAPDDVHEARRALSLAAAAGYRLPAGDDGRLAVRASGGSFPAVAPGYVVVHPGTSVPARAWAPERHAELVAALAGSGRTVIVTGSPSETRLTELVAGDDGIDLGGRTSFGDLAAVLAGADAVVAGNTGPAHLAAAVGTPVVWLFAPTVPAVRWRPWRVPHELLSIDVPCAGCRARTCPVPGHPCLSGVTLDAVLAAVGRLAPAREVALR